MERLYKNGNNMKAITYLAISLIVFTSLFAQTTRNVVVSGKVKKKFVKLYPNVKDAKWSVSKNNVHAEFMQEGKEASAVFKADTLFVTMIQVDVSALPEPVKKYFDKNYKDYVIVKTGKMQFAPIPGGKNICYAAEVTNGKISKRVVCYPDGKEMSVLDLSDTKKK